MEGELRTVAEWVQENEELDKLNEEIVEEEPIEESEEEDPSEDEEEKNVVKIKIENDPPEFEYSSSDDGMDLEESHSNHEGPAFESEDDVDAWIWRSTSPK